MIYAVQPGVDVAIDVQLQGVSDNGMYIGTDASGAEMEVEPRFAMSEREYFDSMSNEEIEGSIDKINRVLASGIQGGSLSNRTLDLRSRLEGELQRRARGEAKSSESLRSFESLRDDGTVGTDGALGVQGNGQNSGVDPVADIVSRAPKQKNGDVDYDALLEERPEDFAVLYESEEGVEEARGELASVSENLSKKIRAEEKRLKGATSINKKKEARKAIADLSGRKKRIDDIIRGKYEVQEAEAVRTQPSSVTGNSKPRKPTARQKRLNTINRDELDTRGKILYDIATGMKFVWGDKISTQGTRLMTGVNNSLFGHGEHEGERRKMWQLLRTSDKGGVYPEGYAHTLFENDGIDTMDGLNEILDILGRVYSSRQALEELEARTNTAEGDYMRGLEEEAYEETARKEENEENNIINDELLPELEKDFASLRNDALESGVPENELNNAYFPFDVINLIEQYSDENRRRNQGMGTGDVQANDAGRNRGVLPAEESERSEGETTGAVAENARRDDRSGREGKNRGQDTDSDTRTVTLTPFQQKQVAEQTVGYNKRIAEAETNLAILQREYNTRKKEIGKRQDLESQNTLFEEPQSDNLFSDELKSDFSRDNLTSIFDELKQQIDAAEKALSDLKNNRDDVIASYVQVAQAQTELPGDFDGDILSLASRVAKNAEIADAERRTDSNPSEAQKEAGNYRKGHVDIQGFSVSIENPKGSIRSGIDRDGKSWSVTMNNTYGYIRGTEGRDHDQIDVFLGENPSSGKVFVVDQMDTETGKFDEHKVMIGFDDIEQAREAYLSNYEEGWQGLMDITETTVDDFRAWANREGRRIKPFADYAEFTRNGWTEEQFDLYRRGVAIVHSLGAITRDRMAVALKNRNFDEIATIVEMMDNSEGFEQAERRFHELGERKPVVWEMDEDNSPYKRAAEAYESLWRRRGGTVRQFNEALDDYERFLDEREKNGPRVRMQEFEDLEAVNERFNKELGALTPENANSKVFNLGYPSQNVLATGLPNHPYRLYGNKIIKKAKEHGYIPTDIKDLPKALANPIAVFKGQDDIFNILTEIEINGERVLVGVQTRHDNEIDFNFIATVFDKSKDGVINWINQGKGLFFDKEKALGYLGGSAPIAEAVNNTRLPESGHELLDIAPPKGAAQADEALDSATKIVQNFENPKLPGEKMQPLPAKAWKKLISRLQKTGLAKEVIIDKAAYQKERYRQEKELTNKNGEVYGFVTADGTVYLDPDKMNANTPIHEFGHLWNGFVKENNPELWEKGRELIKNSPYWNEVNGNPAYAGLSEDAKVDEAIAMAIGDKGEAVVRSGDVLGIARLRAWLNDLWRWIGEHLGVRGLDAGQIERLTLEDFVNGAVADLLSGEEIASSQRRENDDTRFQFTGESEGDGRDAGDGRDSRDGGFPGDDAPGDSETEALRLRIDGKLHDLAYRIRENYQDVHLPVKTLFDELRGVGVKISSFNDFYQNITSLAGRNDFELDRFYEGIFKNMLDSIGAVMRAGKSRREVDNYVMLRHGPERNVYMREKAVEVFEQKLKEKAEREMKDWMKLHRDADKEAVEEAKRRFDGRIAEAVRKKRESVKSKDYAGVKAIAWELRHGAPGRFESAKAWEARKRGIAAMKMADAERLVDDYVAGFESEVGDKLINELWVNVRRATQFSLNKMVQGGILDAKTAEEWIERYEYYVPFRGHDEKTAEDVYDYMRVMGTFYSSPVMTAHGRSSRADDPFAFILQSAQTSINTANVNLLKQGLLRIAQNQDTKGLMSADNAWYERTGTDEAGGAVWEVRYPSFHEDTAQFERNIEEFNERMRELASEGLARQSGAKFDIGGLFIKRPQKDEHVVRVFRDGKEYAIYVNASPRISRAINGENRVTPNVVSAAVGKATRFVAQMSTSRNPAFAVTNFVRDIGYASTSVLAKEGAEYFASFERNLPVSMGVLTRHFAGKGKPSSNKYDMYVYEFLSNGGKTGFTHILELQRTKGKIDRELGRLGHRNVFNSTLSAGEAFLDLLQAGNDIAENASRLATYITSREMGRDVNRSISDAKEVTVNFNRKGAGGMGAAQLMPLYMFMNAGIQGAANFVKNVRMYPRAMTGVIAFNAMLGFMQPFLIRLLAGDDDDEYFKLPEYTRRNNMMIPVGGGDFLKVPLSHELRVFFAIGETAYSVFAGKKDVADGVIDAMSAVSDIVPLNPMSAGSAGLGNVITPDIAKPAYQVWMNKSWTGAPVYNQYANGDFPGYRNIGTNKKGEPYAPEWIVSFAKMLDGATGGDGTKPGRISPNPDVLNHYAKGYLGGLYTLAAQSADVAYKSATEGGVRAKDIPFANRFYTDSDDLNVLATDVAERFYNARGEVKDAAMYLKDYDRRAKKVEIDLLDYASERAKLAGKARFLEGLNAIEKREEMLKRTTGDVQRELEREIAEAKKEWLRVYGGR